MCLLSEGQSVFRETCTLPSVGKRLIFNVGVLIVISRGQVWLFLFLGQAKNSCSVNEGREKEEKGEGET